MLPAPCFIPTRIIYADLLSSHNILQGVVTQVIRTEISTQVTLKVVQDVELTSIIATASAEQLELYEGTEAYAVINPFLFL
ncbi:MAG: TOBE domain-containing protein [Brasilonema angustatum HA4187-MV1]|nr:TOBE domain-containing protein [Brasilonema angustatum HA4187-MV1]